ncbi:MAG: LytTR family DNA-binding domain-containing protein [Ruminococcus sp.]|nr:LytTR family DNA-binding domain-containing protein [Ruminococcus sp.]
MEISVAVCDDEKLICLDIYKKIRQLRRACHIDVYTSGESLLQGKKQYDIIFLDIEMPSANGTEIAENLRNAGRNDYIIFLTSHSEFMSDAFKVRAFRFLTKPIVESDFAEAFLRAEKEILGIKKIAIDTNGRTVLINCSDITVIEAFGSGTYIYTKDNILESKYTLKHWIAVLPSEHFYQVHKSFLVALKYVTTIESTGVQVEFVKEPIAISRRRFKGFKDAFFEYVKNNARCV